MKRFWTSRTASSLAHFFAGGRLNWADYAVDRWVDQGSGGATAIVWEGDDGASRELAYTELKEQIDLAAGGAADRWGSILATRSGSSFR